MILLCNNFECFRLSEPGAIKDEYQQVPLLWAFHVKYYGRHTVILVAGVHVTEELESNFYSVFFVKTITI